MNSQDGHNMKNFYFITKDSFDNMYSVPYFWCSLKTYYEERGEKSLEWNWVPPFLNELTDDEILTILDKEPPSVFGFSVYVWNEERLDLLAQKIKERFPSCLIVYGGPQQNVKHNTNYFREKHWVDITLPADAYGELVLKEILDRYPSEDYSEVPYIYYTDNSRECYFSEKQIDKRAFIWPGPVFEKQKEIILPKIEEERAKGNTIWVYFETSRGCPYKCIYCEWGGGINSKVIKKPFQTVLTDLEWLFSTAKVDGIDIVDANFGIMDIDVEIAKYIAQYKSKYGYPSVVDLDSAKNHPKNVLKIKEILMEAGVLHLYTISLQTLNEEAKKNIERVDLPLEVQVENIRYLEKKFGPLIIYIERILGLPGETYDTFIEQLNKLYELGIDMGVSNPVAWVLLPEAPAYDPNMRFKFKLKTVNKLLEHNPKLKPGKVFDLKGTNINLAAEWENSSVETVIETYSYSKEEWLRMRTLLSWALAGHVIGFNNYFVKYLVQEHGAKPSDIFNHLMDLVYKEGFNNPDIDNWIRKDQEQSLLWLNEDSVKNISVDLGDEWPFYIPQQVLFVWLALTNSTKFFDSVGVKFAKEYNDPKILDLAVWMSNVVIDIEFNSERTVSTIYNWATYFQENAPLVEGAYQTTIAVDSVGNSGTFEWNNFSANSFERKLTFFYQIAAKTKTVKVPQDLQSRRVG